MNVPQPFSHLDVLTFVLIEKKLLALTNREYHGTSCSCKFSLKREKVVVKVRAGKKRELSGCNEYKVWVARKPRREVNTFLCSFFIRLIYGLKVF